MDISVIIANWNGEKFLEECLGSLEDSHGGLSVEVIIIDNASTDGSVQLVRRRFPKVRLVENCANLGFAKANNQGLRLANGRYLALVNSDIVFKDDCLLHLYHYMEQNPRVGLVGPRVFGADGLDQLSMRGFPTLWNMFCRALAVDRLFPWDQVTSGYLRLTQSRCVRQPAEILSGCFWFARAEAVRTIGELDERFFMYGEDMDWCKRFAQGDWGVVYVPEAQVVHYGGASSNQSPVRFYIEKQKADLQYWQKHHGAFRAAIMRVVLFLHHSLRVILYCTASLCNPKNNSLASKRSRSLATLRWLLGLPFRHS